MLKLIKCIIGGASKGLKAAGKTIASGAKKAVSTVSLEGSKAIRSGANFCKELTLKGTIASAKNAAVVVGDVGGKALSLGCKVGKKVGKFVGKTALTTPIYLYGVKSKGK